LKLNKIYFKAISKDSKESERCEAMRSMLSALPLEEFFIEKSNVGVKTHFGDVNNTTHISPEIIKVVVDKLKNYNTFPFLMETATLYSGPRQNAITHIEHAYKHGFTFEKVGAPIIMVDGLLGNAEIEVKIPGMIYDSVNIARDAVYSDAIVFISHPTGHIVTGMGACLKNLGMGLASRKGKLKQHSSIKPQIITDKCVYCLECIKWCPEDSILDQTDHVFIVEEKCIGCGECISVCKYQSIGFNYAVESGELQKRMAEYALGAIIDKKDKCLYINVLTDMTSQCDCMGFSQKPIIPDIGILAGFDPVALDQATLDITKKENGDNLGRLSLPELDPEIQLVHAEKIGMGSRKYEIIPI